MIRALLFVVLWPQLLLAAVPQDFAGGFALEVEPGQPLQRLELPYAVHRASARSDLGDMRVFDAQGREMPLQVRSAQRPGGEELDFFLPMFRVRADAPAGPNLDLRLQVRTSEQGAVVEARIRPEDETRTLDLVLDASQITMPLTALRVFLAADLDSFVPVTVRASNDLAVWTEVGRGVLASMQHVHGRILQDRINLRGQKWKYYLLSGPDAGPVVSAVHGVSSRDDVAALRRWTTLDGRKIEDGLYEYELPPSLPVDVLDLADADNAVLSLTVLTQEHSGAWRPDRSGSLFHLVVNGQALAGPALNVSPLPPRFRLRVQGNEAALRAGWLVREAVFMAQGQAPYTLAMGNPSVPAGPELLASMLGAANGQDMPMGRAALGPAVVLGGPDRLEPVPSFKKMLLWGILGLGVAVLGAMAWHLARGLGRPV